MSDKKIKVELTPDQLQTSVGVVYGFIESVDKLIASDPDKYRADLASDLRDLHEVFAKEWSDYLDRKNWEDKHRTDIPDDEAKKLSDQNTEFRKRIRDSEESRNSKA